MCHEKQLTNASYFPKTGGQCQINRQFSTHHSWILVQTNNASISLTNFKFVFPLVSGILDVTGNENSSVSGILHSIAQKCKIKSLMCNS